MGNFADCPTNHHPGISACLELTFAAEFAKRQYREAFDFVVFSAENARERSAKPSANAGGDEHSSLKGRVCHVFVQA